MDETRLLDALAPTLGWSRLLAYPLIISRKRSLLLGCLWRRWGGRGLRLNAHGDDGGVESLDIPH